LKSCERRLLWKSHPAAILAAGKGSSGWLGRFRGAQEPL